MNVFALPLKDTDWDWLFFCKYIQICSILSVPCWFLSCGRGQGCVLAAGQPPSLQLITASLCSGSIHLLWTQSFWILVKKKQKRSKKKIQKGWICWVAAQCKRVLMLLQLKKDPLPRLMRGGDCSSLCSSQSRTKGGMFGESLGTKGWGSADLLPDPGNPPDIQRRWTRTFSVCKQEPMDFLGLCERKDVKIFQTGDLEQIELSEQLWNGIIMIKLWGLKAAAGVVGDPVVDAEPGAAGKACFPEIQGGKKVWGRCFSPPFAWTYFRLLSCHKRSNLFNFTKCYWSCWKWSCSPRLLDKWVCVFLEGS